MNKVLVDGGATINLISHFMMQKVGKFDTDLMPYDMVVSNYEGKSGHTMG